MAPVTPGGVRSGTRGNDSRRGTLEALSFGGRKPLPRVRPGGSHCLADEEATRP
jgi:hypothetical protein